MQRLALALALPLLAALPALAEEDHHVSDLNGLRVVHAWTNATDGDTALVYLDAENGSASPAVLTGGAAEFASAVDLVGFRLIDGAESWVALPGIPVPAGAEMVLEPKAIALRLTGLAGPLVEGTEVEMAVIFDTGTLEVHVEVGAAGATAHSHAGHMH